MEKATNRIKLAAIGDIHIKETSTNQYRDMLAHISEVADILLLCGDLTDLGLEEEAEVLVKELTHCTLPIVAVLGNHDYENNNQSLITHMLMKMNVQILQGTEYIFEKNGRCIGFTGVKGFGGGFRPAMWGRFGEPEQKAFYDAVATEVQKLEVGLNRLARSQDIDKKIVLLHFSPIRETLQGEMEELYAFLGSTRLEEVIDRYDVDAVFHGHAHFGTFEGKTEKDIPVYNCSLPVMKKINENQPFALIEI